MRVLIALFLGFVISMDAREANSQEPLIEIRTIGIPPYGISGKSASSGIYYDFSNLLINEAGYRGNNYVYPYVRIMKELKTGQTDMTIMFKYPELDNHVIYVAALPALETVVVGSRGTKFNSIADLKGKTIAYLRGATFSDEIDQDTDIIKRVTDDFTQGVRMLQFGRIDAIIGPIDPIVDAAMVVGDGESFLGEPFPVSERTPWIQISKKSVGKLSPIMIERAFLDLSDRGEFMSIAQKYRTSAGTNR